MIFLEDVVCEIVEYWCIIQFYKFWVVVNNKLGICTYV